MATQAKKDLRRRINHKLSSLSDDEVLAQSTVAEGMILAMPEYKAASRIGIYLSMPTSEAQTDMLIRDALSNHKAVFVPHLYSPGPNSSAATSKRKAMDMLQLRSPEEYQRLERDSWGIPTLPSQGLKDRDNAMGGKGVQFDRDDTDDTEEKAAGLDLIVVPAVAFDRDMNRLGHGAGFYDSFLTRFCSVGRRRKPYLVGLCLAEQVLPHGEMVAMQDWDWKVDVVVAGDGSFLTSKDTT